MERAERIQKLLLSEEYDKRLIKTAPIKDQEEFDTVFTDLYMKLGDLYDFVKKQPGQESKDLAKQIKKGLDVLAAPDED